RQGASACPHLHCRGVRHLLPGTQITEPRVQERFLAARHVSDQGPTSNLSFPLFQAREDSIDGAPRKLMRLPVSPVRRLLANMLKQALTAAHAGRALQRSLRKDGNHLTIGRRRYDLRDYKRVVVVGAGKASAAMARAIEPILGRRLEGGFVIV